jgi:glycosyltransferase involved in cell wall biosynthesis
LGVTVIPNGVDASFYSRSTRCELDRDRIVFTGVMSAPPNLVAAQRLATRILPLVRAVRPTAHLAIVGREPPTRVLALAEREGVKVTGEVSDVRPWLTGSRVFVCPMTIGSGIKNKLLEAMASALPCVATPLALGGLTVRPDEELLVADRDEDLAREIVRVLDDDKLAARLGEAARAYVLAHHTWRGAARAFERVYHEVCAAAA